MRQRIILSDLKVGDPSPWDVYDAGGKLLLKQHEKTPARKLLELYVETGLFIQLQEFDTRPLSMGGSGSRNTNNGNSTSPTAPASVATTNSALQLIVDARRAFTLMMNQNLEQTNDIMLRIERMSSAITEACEVNQTVALASILMLHDTTYVVRHPIDVAILTHVLATEQGIDPEMCRTAIAAALTMNIGMHEVQEKVLSINGPLNDKLKDMIRRHPQMSVERLRTLGITDERWLSLILQHHENHDGSGYPNGLSGDQISQCSRIIGVADKYCAMVSLRQYHGPHKPQIAMRELYAQKDQLLGNELTNTLIKVLGIYPPGTLVRLKSTEIAVVTGPGGPGSTLNTPTVHAVIGRTGQPLEVAFLRKTHLPATEIEDVLTYDALSIPIRMASIWGSHAKLH